jgi:APA family basic amino acid/polyamine antiporter
VLITIGGVIGSAIFLAASDVPKALPHAGLVLLAWLLGGVLTLAGATTYAELGTMYPEAGGQYHFLKQAFGPLSGFLFGWASFLVIMSGGIATLAVGFGEYVGAFVPTLGTGHVLARVRFGSWSWTLSAGQLVGCASIVLLTAVNYRGVRQGAAVQNLVTWLKLASLAAIAAYGLLGPAPAAPRLLAPLPPGPLLAPLGVAMIAVFWSFDGWYNLTFNAGEMRAPRRDLPRGLVIGVLACTVVYALMNVAYVRVLPLAEMAAAPRVGEAAALVLFGPAGSRLVAAAVLVSIFGCLSATILGVSRIYLPMAEDGVFFRSVARIHPRYRTPGASLIAQGIWASILALSGTYSQLFTYVVVAAILFHALTGVALFVLRWKRPDAARPYRCWGYPWVPAAFVLSSFAFVANALFEKPVESLWGMGLIALGLPAYAWWRRRLARS